MSVSYGRYYSRWHDSSDIHYEKAVENEALFISGFLPSDTEIAILEIGCGMGFMLAALKTLGIFNIEGIDSDRSQVTAAQSRNLPVSLVPADSTVAFLGERTGRYDCIILIDVLEHIPVAHTLDFLESIRGALTQNGRLICRVPNCDAFTANRFRYSDWTHHTTFSAESLDFVLHSAGFVDITVSATERETRNTRVGVFRYFDIKYILRSFSRSLLRLFYALELGFGEASRLLLTPNIVAVCRSPDGRGSSSLPL